MNDTFTEAIAKFNALTQDGTLRWAPASTAKITEGTDDVVPIAFCAEIHGKRMRIYQKKYLHWLDESTHVWDYGYVLELIDNDGNAIFEFPSSVQTRHLLESVTQQVSGVEDLLKHMLG